MFQVLVGGSLSYGVRQTFLPALLVAASVFALTLSPTPFAQADARNLAAQEETQRRRREFAIYVDRIRRENRAGVCVRRGDEQSC